jgi:hypothetical protein
MVTRYTEINKLKDNLTIKTSDLAGLKSASNLKYLKINNATFENLKLINLYIDKATELEYLDLTGSVGLVMTAAFPDQTGIYPFCPVPMEWRFLTKLKTISLRNCGLTPTKIDNFIIGLSQVVAQGLGSATSGNKLYIDGDNGAPTGLSATQINYLEGEGWQIIQGAASTSLPYYTSTGSPILVNAAVSLATPLNNGEGETVIVSVSGLMLGGNNSISLSTDLSALPNVDVTAVVLADGELTVTVTNNTGDDDVTIPTLNFNIYIS